MKRLAWVWLLVPLLAACTSNGGSRSAEPYVAGGTVALTPWQATPCPSGSTETVKDRLDDIKAWATADGQTTAYNRADACLLHTGINDLHVARVYAAWVMADYAYSNSGTLKSWFWTLCTSELTHDNNGGGGPG